MLKGFDSCGFYRNKIIYASEKKYFYHHGYRGGVSGRTIYQEGDVWHGGRDCGGVVGGYADSEQKKIRVFAMQRINEDIQEEEEKVPLLKKWSYWYALVIGFLLLCIGFFYFLTKHFS